MKMRYYHKKKAVKTAIKLLGVESYMLQKKERRIEQANNSSIKFENRLKNLGVNQYSINFKTLSQWQKKKTKKQQIY